MQFNHLYDNLSVWEMYQEIDDQKCETLSSINNERYPTGFQSVKVPESVHFATYP